MLALLIVLRTIAQPLNEIVTNYNLTKHNRIWDSPKLAKQLRTCVKSLSSKTFITDCNEIKITVSGDSLKHLKNNFKCVKDYT